MTVPRSAVGVFGNQILALCVDRSVRVVRRSAPSRRLEGPARLRYTLGRQSRNHSAERLARNRVNVVEVDEAIGRDTIGFRERPLGSENRPVPATVRVACPSSHLFLYRSIVPDICTPQNTGPCTSRLRRVRCTIGTPEMVERRNPAVYI